jgi:D-alanyl-D-alanine carboxypeptidase
MQDAFSRIDAAAKQHMDAESIPGLTLAITNRERTLYVGAYGYANLEARTPATPDHLFEIGSISKSFTTLALMQHVEAGRIDLYAPVTHYLPWLEIASDYEPIRIHDLLTHRAGITEGSDFALSSRYGARVLGEIGAAAPPGEHFAYSNLGFKILGWVLASLDGKEYGDLIRERVLGPLGMEASSGQITLDTRPRMAVGYGSAYPDRPFHRRHGLAPATWLETNTGDGSIVSTAGDMAIYARMLLNRGATPGGRIASEESFETMTTPHVALPEWGEHAAYGYGVAVNREREHALVEHDGGMVGYTSALVTDMDAGLGAIVLANMEAENRDLAMYAIKVMAAATAGDDLPPPPEAPDPAKIEKAGDHAGTYRRGEASLSFRAEGDHLLLEHGGESIPLEMYGPFGLLAPHPDFARYLLKFERDETGRVVEVGHGPDWYANDTYDGPTTFDTPAEWASFTGHYIAYNPWYGGFRIFVRKGELRQAMHFGAEHVLEPAGGRRFRLTSPREFMAESLAFDALIEGKTQRARWSGQDYYRTFTP